MFYNTLNSYCDNYRGGCWTNTPPPLHVSTVASKEHLHLHANFIIEQHCYKQYSNIVLYTYNKHTKHSYI